MQPLTFRAAHGLVPDAAPVTRDQAAPGEAGPACDDEVISSAELLQGRKVVQIEHNGALYMLRTTKLGKLILTK